MEMHDVFRVKSKLTFPVVQCHIPDIFSSLPQMPLAVVVHIIWRCFSSCMQYGDWKWLKKYSRRCLLCQQFYLFCLRPQCIHFSQFLDVYVYRKTSFLVSQVIGRLTAHLHFIFICFECLSDK